MNALLVTIIVFLGILSLTLLYSLMLADVDAKTYQFGMLRALGLQKLSLIGLITVQSTFFSIPGLISGLIAAYVLNTAGRFAIFRLSFNYTNY